MISGAYILIWFALVLSDNNRPGALTSGSESYNDLSACMEAGKLLQASVANTGVKVGFSCSRKQTP